MTFGQFIKQKRLKMNLTQTDLADHFGYKSYMMVSYLENGLRQWTLYHVFDIAKLFDMPASELLKEFETLP